jgi:hypothetical protein
MAYDKSEIEQKAIEAIKDNELTFFDEICLFVEPSRATLYNLELDKLDSIKESLAKNKLKKKNKMRKKWEDSDNATLQISAYKLLATDEELEKLTVNNNKNQHSGELGIIWKEEKTYEANEETNHSDRLS